MTKEEANKKLAEMVAEFNAKLQECMDFADEHKLNFSIYPEYGMGGTYRGEDERTWGQDIYDLETKWSPSSIGC